jgi:hypothetical protein
LASRSFAINHSWLTTTMIAGDLLAFTRTLLLHDTGLARAEPKTLRYRLLHTAARLTRGNRRFWLRIDQHWPWGAPARRRVRPPRRTACPGRLT